jgi:multidrug resistance efflux pump
MSANSSPPKVLRFAITLGVVLCGLGFAWMLYLRYEGTPWSRDGQVQANIVGIAPRVSGPIINIPLRDNQEVKIGDLLFEIDPATFQAALDQARGELLQAEADFTQKTQNLARQKQLFETRVIDAEDFEDAQDAFAASQAAVATAQANVRLAQLNLEYTKVFSPVNGYLTNLTTSPGTYVSAGEQLLAVVDRDSFWIAGYFKETQLQHIRSGDRANLRLMGHFWSPFTGRVESVGWGIFLENGNTVNLLPNVYQTVDWVRLPNRFPVRIQVVGQPPVPLRIGQTVSISVHADNLPALPGNDGEGATTITD